MYCKARRKEQKRTLKENERRETVQSTVMLVGTYSTKLTLSHQEDT